MLKILILFLLITPIFQGCASFFDPYHLKDLKLIMPSGFNNLVFGKEKKKMVIAVLDFVIPESKAKLIDMNPAQRLVTMLGKTKKFDIIERSDIQKLLNEQALGQTGLIDENTAAKLGRMLGANAVVLGQVSSLSQKPTYFPTNARFETLASIDIRIVDVSTGKIIYSETAEGDARTSVDFSPGIDAKNCPVNYPSYTDPILRALEFVPGKLGKLLPPTGYVISVNDKKITLNTGENEGVLVGDYFIIFRKGKVIVDPVTKKELGFEKEVLGAMKILTVENDTTTGVVFKKRNSEMIIPGDMAIYSNDLQSFINSHWWFKNEFNSIFANKEYQ